MIAIITSQHFLDEDIVAAKVAAADFDVLVSPAFNVDGEQYRVILDGNHSFAAAVSADAAPNLIEATASEHDAVGLLDSGDVEGFLAALWMDGDYRDAATHRAAF